MGKSCSPSGPYVLFVLCLFVILLIKLISRFGFERGIRVLIVSVPDHCLLVQSTLQEEFDPPIIVSYNTVLVSACITPTLDLLVQLNVKFIRKSLK